MKRCLIPSQRQVDLVAACVTAALQQSTDGVMHGFDPEDLRSPANSGPSTRTKKYIKDFPNKGGRRSRSSRYRDRHRQAEGRARRATGVPPYAYALRAVIPHSAIGFSGPYPMRVFGMACAKAVASCLYFTSETFSSSSSSRGNSVSRRNPCSARK